MFRGAIQERAAKPWAKWTTLSETAAASSLWKEQDKKALDVNGLKISMGEYLELAGAKYKYAQRKEELKRALSYPLKSDQELVSESSCDVCRKGRTDMSSCRG